MKTKQPKPVRAWAYWFKLLPGRITVSLEKRNSHEEVYIVPASTYRKLVRAAKKGGAKP